MGCSAGTHPPPDPPGQRCRHRGWSPRPPTRFLLLLRLALELDVQVLKLAAAARLVLHLAQAAGRQDPCQHQEHCQHPGTAQRAGGAAPPWLARRLAALRPTLHPLPDSTQAAPPPGASSSRPGPARHHRSPTPPAASPTHLHVLLRQQHALKALLVRLAKQRDRLAQRAQPPHHLLPRQLLGCGRGRRAAACGAAGGWWAAKVAPACAVQAQQGHARQQGAIKACQGRRFARRLGVRKAEAAGRPTCARVGAGVRLPRPAGRPGAVGAAILAATPPRFLRAGRTGLAARHACSEQVPRQRQSHPAGGLRRQARHPAPLHRSSRAH